MKTLHTFSKFKLGSKGFPGILLIAFATCFLSVQAEDSKQHNEDLATLQQLLKMPKDDLKRVRLSLESIEKMSPTDRKKALQRIQDLNKMPTQQRKETINRWNELSPEMKKSYFDYLRKLSAGDRKKFKELPWDKQIAQIKDTAKK